jgi:hypothetical protein
VAFNATFNNISVVFIFCFYFQQFKNITQTSSILLFWQTNNTIVFTLSTGRIVHGSICLERRLKIRVMADKSDKSAPGLHPFIATVSMLDWVGKTPLNVTT